VVTHSAESSESGSSNRCACAGRSSRPARGSPDAHAHGYGLLGRRRLHDVSLLDPSWAGAAGALVSTVSDLPRFHRALRGGRLLRPDLLREMQTTVPVTAQQRYGLGLIMSRRPCGRSWGHGGDIPGYWTTAENTRDGRRQVVLALNASDESLPERAQEARERFLLTAFCG
jgi:D-alanyl-D-alanine carboxypeptidase